MGFTDVIKSEFATFRFYKNRARTFSILKSAVTITTDTLHIIFQIIGKFVHKSSRFEQSMKKS